MSIEAFVHTTLGAAYTTWGDIPSKVPVTGHPGLTAKNPNYQLYEPLLQYMPLQLWGILHLIVAFVLVLGMGLNRWNRLVHPCLFISVLFYVIMVVAMIFGISSEGHGVPLSNSFFINAFSIIVAMSAFAALSFYAYAEPPVNPATSTTGNGTEPDRS